MLCEFSYIKLSNAHRWHFHKTNKSFPLIVFIFLSSILFLREGRKQTINLKNNFCMIDYEKHLILWSHEASQPKCFYFLAWVPDSKCHSKEIFLRCRVWYFTSFHKPLFFAITFSLASFCTNDCRICYQKIKWWYSLKHDIPRVSQL